MLDATDLAQISKVFKIYEVREDGPTAWLFGEPMADASQFYGTLYPHFSRKGKAVRIQYRLGEYVVIVGPAKKDPVWINVVLAAATFLTTMLVGATMYGVDLSVSPMEAYKGLPFAIAIMVVLGSHELSHYLVSKKYGIDASLPYFIPFPFSPIGTMGAVIRQKSPVPTRRALFDMGISGPLAGLAVAIVVTIIGLMLPAPGVSLHIQMPLLFKALVLIVQPGSVSDSLNPIAFAGWVGMLLTVMNLFPVGQLDGGHVSRAVLGPLADRVSQAIPICLMVLGIAVTLGLGQDGEIWIFWGLLTLFMGNIAHPKPTDDTQPIGWQRMALAAATVVIALLCFTLAPISMS